MNRKQLVEAVADAAQLTAVDANKLFGALLKIVTARLKAGDIVRVTGFGKFDVVERRAMEIRGPRNGERIAVGVTKRVRFTPSVELRQALKRQRPFVKSRVIAHRGFAEVP